jgi:hypothetical protein
MYAETGALLGSVYGYPTDLTSFTLDGGHSGSNYSDTSSTVFLRRVLLSTKYLPNAATLPN